ncbi:MAG: Radical SAM domain-containing [Rhodospirillaceae bacterium]|nr:MAG: Radical SAM domain-containing [Rhodospirillaceae bacterium]TNC97488.1 MAG: Radical SAM domain-containing protein [Stygiobacter sp.]
MGQCYRDSGFDALGLLRRMHEEGPLSAPVRQPKVVHISLYCFKSFALRLFHNLTNNCGVESHCIFLKDTLTNRHTPISAVEMTATLDLIRRIDPDLITLSVMAPYVVAARDLTARIRAVTDAPVMIGGKFATISPAEALDFTDYACKGEGELALIEAYDRLKSGNRDLRGIVGLWFKGDDGIVIDMGQQRLIEDLDVLPFQALGEPNMHFIEYDRCTTDDPEIDNDEIWVMAGRGCVYLCSYCVNSLLIPMNRGNGRFVRLRSPDSAIAEIKHLWSRQPKAHSVSFNDEVFGVFDEWTDEFARKYKEQVGLPFHCELVPKLIKEDNVRKLADAGLNELHFGIQSGSDEIRRDVLKRPGKNPELVEKAHLLARIGVVPQFDIILGSPFDTVEVMEETVDMMLLLPAPMKLNTYQMQYFPHYPLTNQALERGFITPADLTYEVLAERVMKNMVFIPKISRNRKDQLEAAVYLLPWHSTVLRALTAQLRRKPNDWLGMALGWIALMRYHHDFLANPALIMVGRVVRAARMIGRGEFSRLAGKILGRLPVLSAR